MATELNPQDPHSSGYVAETISEAVRALNHSTQHDGGLNEPDDVADVLGELSSALYRLPQALRQMRQWVAAEHRCGRLDRDDGSEAASAVHALTKMLDEASADAAGFGLHLAEAQTVAAKLRPKE